MGAFSVTITATGPHGCQREIGDGKNVGGCGRVFCPDCKFRRMVAELNRSGCKVTGAVLTHGPGTKEVVVDDLISTKRTGSFEAPKPLDRNAQIAELARQGKTNDEINAILGTQ
jgi:hypothetical protein